MRQSALTESAAIKTSFHGAVQPLSRSRHARVFAASHAASVIGKYGMQLNCSSKDFRSCARAPPRTSNFTGPHHAASYSSKRFSSANLTSRRPSRRNASIHTDESTSTMTALNVALFGFVVGGGIIKHALPQHPSEILRFFPVDKIPDSKSHRRTVFPVAGHLQQFIQSFFVQFNGHSHAEKMIQKTSFVNHKNI